MSNNIDQLVKAKERVEFIPHALGEIKGDISRDEIYHNRFGMISEIPAVNPFDQTADEKTSE